MKRLSAILALLVSLSALGQTPKPSPLAQCRADNDALRADLARLRQEIDDLRKAADAKAAEIAAAKAAVTADAPFRDALAALRAVDSVILTGSYLDFKKYFLEAKVKVDSLPSSARASKLHGVIDLYADAESVWQSYVLNQQILYRRNIGAIMERNPGLSSAARVQFSSGEYTSLFLDSVINFFAESAKAKLAAIE